MMGGKSVPASGDGCTAGRRERNLLDQNRFMKSAARPIIVAAFGSLVVLIGILTAPRQARSQSTPAGPFAGDTKPAVGGRPASPPSPSSGSASVAPFIVKDTDTDSPGTNIVTRIVTFSARVDGTPPPALQWKVDHGKGYELLTDATNPVFRIGNAQVLDSGFYSLFATNSAGSIHTTPQQLVVTEGED